MARYLIDVDNEDWLDENWETISADDLVETHTLDKSSEGQFYTELTDDEITQNLFEAVHLAIVDRIGELEDEDGEFFLEDKEDFDAKKVLNNALKHYKRLMEDEHS